MEAFTKIKVVATSVAIALGCAGITYAFLKFKYRLKEAATAFNYLQIQNITSESSCNYVIVELRKRCTLHKAIGFDCEWVTDGGSRHTVALVQLSTFDGLCGLFRINQLNGIPESLKDLLEDEKIYKVGVAPADDARYLHSDYGVLLQSSLDIRHIALHCGYNPGGLAALAKSHLHVIMDKSWRIRCSDWEAENLTDRQMKYAAVDAHVAIRIFAKLISELQGMSENIFRWLMKKKVDSACNVEDLCKKYANISFKGKNVPAKDPKSNSSKYKDTKVAKRYPHATRSKPLYHNCFLEAPDGELLCTCDNKKALWYVEKGLADIVKEDPLSVRLRFEPAGRSVGAVGRYYQLTKQNQCVVCGATNSYIRKNVVPREYRKYLPDIMKEHSSHDVVLLCGQCHRRSNALDRGVRASLASVARAPEDSGASKYRDDVDAKKIRSAARALMYQSKKHDLPELRIQELKQILMDYYECTEISDELLKQAADIPTIIENFDYEAHGAKVVEHFMSQERGLLQLEEIWRKHFLEAMRPRYMPELWSVTHNEERLKVRLKEGRLSNEELKLLGLTKWCKNEEYKGVM